MFQFGHNSLKNLKTCHPEIIVLMKEALFYSPIDFGISCGYRTTEEQQRLFKNGKTKCDGIIKVGNHQNFPSDAVDIYAYVNSKLSYDPNHLCVIAGVVLSVAKELKLNIRWGGTFGSKDWHGWDMPHYERKA